MRKMGEARKWVREKGEVRRRVGADALPPVVRWEEDGEVRGDALPPVLR
jgi:hypothetical protein